ncbi:MAG: hypothetical protein IAG10_16920, partial [Planctomycetaceae bacterium]|nr:hypothetical protein [Planctomycetaceae bacterium]
DALALLSETQRRRTEQLKLQQQGVRAFSTAAVAEKLGLTQAQRDEIAKLNRTSSSFGRDRTTNNDGQNTSAADRFQQLRESSSRRSAETREKILAVLTPEQKAKWSELTGEPFLFPSRSRSTSRGTSTRSSEPVKSDAQEK